MLLKFKFKQEYYTTAQGVVINVGIVNQETMFDWEKNSINSGQHMHVIWEY